jgi:hypothetical protein
MPSLTAGRLPRAPWFAWLVRLVQAISHGVCIIGPVGAIHVAEVQFAAPVAGANIHRQDLHAVAARVLDQLRRSVEPHGLRIQERRQKGFRLMALEP